MVNVTSQETCPVCGKPAELLQSLEGRAIYACRFCGNRFEADLINKPTEAPEFAQPARATGRGIGDINETMPKSAKLKKNKTVDAPTEAQEQTIKVETGDIINKPIKFDEDFTDTEKAAIEKALLNKQNDPYAICTEALGEQHTDKWRRCVTHVQSRL